MHANLDADRELTALLETWTAKKGDRRLPRRSDFDFYDCKRWLGHLAVVKVLDGPKRYRVTLHGTAAAAYYGKDFTNQFLEDLFVGPELAPLLDAYYRAYETLQPVRMTTAPFALLDKAKRMERLILPLGTDERVEHLLAGIYPAN